MRQTVCTLKYYWAKKKILNSQGETLSLWGWAREVETVKEAHPRSFHLLLQLAPSPRDTLFHPLPSEKASLMKASNLSQYGTTTYFIVLYNSMFVTVTLILRIYFSWS
jgi:hypothetical protein